MHKVRQRINYLQLSEFDGGRIGLREGDLSKSPQPEPIHHYYAVISHGLGSVNC